MTTIRVNERTKAGKALIETARLMAEKFKGTDITEDSEENDTALLRKMIAARKSGVVDRSVIFDALNSIIEK
jgi:hypothetical protein